ncbi:chromate transporter [Aquincola sp. S2]|uniref:Chromate transporter n=1 Tax=Pseudaquabacterium terrae TaxID=2732868 RepID=A0ABX2EJE6_9BURK|nr:chromate transporter [Aquabacterium terrae]NRF68772.1 chromate transporter [Aquabacterium terrae]
MLAAAAELWGLHGLDWDDLLKLTLHFALLSMLAVGGAITTAPDMQRYLVHEQLWLSDAQFTASVAIAQAAPGPNILFVALLGLNVAGAAGLVAAMAGILLPSSLVAWGVGRLGRRRSESIALRAFTAGLTPLTLGLLLSTGWVLTAPTREHAGTWVLIAATVAAMAWTKLSPLWLIAAGAVAGMFGLVG